MVRYQACTIPSEFNDQVRVLLYGQPVNVRLSFDGLYALAKYIMRQDPLPGNLFAFIHRRATQLLQI